MLAWSVINSSEAVKSWSWGSVDNTWVSLDSSTPGKVNVPSSRVTPSGELVTCEKLSLDSISPTRSKAVPKWTGLVESANTKPESASQNTHKLSWCVVTVESWLIAVEVSLQPKSPSPSGLDPFDGTINSILWVQAVPPVESVTSNLYSPGNKLLRVNSSVAILFVVWVLNEFSGLSSCIRLITAV